MLVSFPFEDSKEKGVDGLDFNTNRVDRLSRRDRIVVWRAISVKANVFFAWLNANGTRGLGGTSNGVIKELDVRLK